MAVNKSKAFSLSHCVKVTLSLVQQMEFPKSKSLTLQFVIGFSSITLSDQEIT